MKKQTKADDVPRTGGGVYLKTINQCSKNQTSKPYRKPASLKFREQWTRRKANTAVVVKYDDETGETITTIII